MRLVEKGCCPNRQDRSDAQHNAPNLPKRPLSREFKPTKKTQCGGPRAQENKLPFDDTFESQLKGTTACTRQATASKNQPKAHILILLWAVNKTATLSARTKRMVPESKAVTTWRTVAMATS